VRGRLAGSDHDLLMCLKDQVGGVPGLVDFVPDTPPYEFLTVVELEPANGGVQVTMTVDSMHDPVWTERPLAGRGNELDNLATLIQSRR
jgi:hypothetical protein